MRVCVDLCSGLGGFSQSFVNHGWKVVTVDIEPKFKPTVVGDVTKIDWNEFKQTWLNGESPDVLLASPPCERFSIACRTWPKMGIKKAMELVGACFEAVAILKPKCWLIENPMGRLRWFLGKPGMTIRQCDYGAPYEKKTDLWGNIFLPLLEGTKDAKFWVFKEGHFNAKKPKPTPNFFIHGTSGSGNGKALRAKIPLGVSEAVYESCQRLFSEIQESSGEEKKAK